MTTLLFISFIFLVMYFLCLFYFAAGFLSAKPFFSINQQDEDPLTIIICARNEEKNIIPCLLSVIKQDYPKDKVNLILINDASSDKTVKHAEHLLKESDINYKIISNHVQKGKKQSISYAMQFVNTDLIITRDADTYTTSTIWLKTISDFYKSTKSDFIIAPVILKNNIGLLWALQAFENNILAVLAAGSAFFGKPFLCNGANLAFTKKIFQKVKGYSSHINIASGDDVLFLEDVKRISDVKINYLISESALVYTYPVLSFNELIKQKVRWASKFKSNPNKLNLILAILSFTVNLLWIYCLISGFLIPQKARLDLFFILFKLAIDSLLLILASRFLKNRTLLWYAVPVGFIYPVYACVVALASLFLKPKWK